MLLNFFERLRKDFLTKLTNCSRHQIVRKWANNCCINVLIFEMFIKSWASFVLRLNLHTSNNSFYFRNILFFVAKIKVSLKNKWSVLTTKGPSIRNGSKNKAHRLRNGKRDFGNWPFVAYVWNLSFRNYLHLKCRHTSSQKPIIFRAMTFPRSEANISIILVLPYKKE